jgi:hypothetical protein
MIAIFASKEREWVPCSRHYVEGDEAAIPRDRMASVGPFRLRRRHDAMVNLHRRGSACQDSEVRELRRKNTTGEQELICRTGCLHLGALDSDAQAPKWNALRSNSETFMSHRSPAADTKTTFQVRSKSPQTSYVSSRYFLLRQRVIDGHWPKNGIWHHFVVITRTWGSETQEK